MTDIIALKAVNAHRWANMHMRADRLDAFPGLEPPTPRRAIRASLNGLGYASRGVPSAYVWSGTDQYVSGKYVADHVYRASAIDVQEGCAPIMAMMMALDSNINILIAGLVADRPDRDGTAERFRKAIDINIKAHAVRSRAISQSAGLED